MLGQSTVEQQPAGLTPWHLLSPVFPHVLGAGGGDRGCGSRPEVPFLKANKQTLHTAPQSQDFFPLISILGLLLTHSIFLIYLPSVKESLYFHPLNKSDLANLEEGWLSPTTVLLRMSSGGPVRGAHSCSQLIKGRGDCVLDFISLSLVCVGHGAKILSFFFFLNYTSSVS